MIVWLCGSQQVKRCSTHTCLRQQVEKEARQGTQGRQGMTETQHLVDVPVPDDAQCARPHSNTILCAYHAALILCTGRQIGTSEDSTAFQFLSESQSPMCKRTNERWHEQQRAHTTTLEHIAVSWCSHARWLIIRRPLLSPAIQLSGLRNP